MLHAALLLWVAGAGHLHPRQRRPARDGVAARRLDPGRAARLDTSRSRSPSRRFGSRSPSSSCSRGSSSSRCRPRPRSSRSVRGTRLVVARSVWCGPAAAASVGFRARRGVESSGRGPGPVDGDRPCPARGDCGRVRAHGARQAGALADPADARRRRSSRRTGSRSRMREISFQLRTRERISVWIETSDGRRVRHLLTNRTFPRRLARRPGLGRVRRQRARRARRDVPAGREARALAPDDRAAEPDPARHEAARDHRPPPALPDHLPGRRRRHDTFRVHYTVNEPAHAILAVRGRRVEFTRGQKLSGVLVWNGTLNGRPARPGRYVLTVAAQDTAGNVAKPFPFAIAQVRYVTLARDRIVVKPGRRFAMRVSTDAPTVRWQLHGRSGEQPRGTLHFRAPKSAASTGCTSSRAITLPGRLWSSDEPLGRTGRRRGRLARPRAAVRGDAPRPARRRPRGVGGRLRHPHHLPRAARPSPRARRRSGRRPGRRRRRRVDRRPRAVAARGRHARVRAGAHPRARRLDTGEPAAAALRRRRGRGARARVGAVRRRRAVARARAARVAARAAHRLDRSVVPLDAGRAAGRDRAALLRPAVRAAHRRRSRGSSGRAPGC